MPGTRHLFAPAMTMKQAIHGTVIDFVPDTLGVSSPDLPFCSDLPALGLSKKGVRNSFSSSNVRYCRRPPFLWFQRLQRRDGSSGRPHHGPWPWTTPQYRAISSVDLGSTNALEIISHRYRQKARGSVLSRFFTSSMGRRAAARVTLAISSFFWASASAFI